jgi:hypothetical protein
VAKGVDLEGLESGEFRERVAELDAWLQEVKTTSRQQAMQREILDAETTSVAEGLAAGDPQAQLVRELQRMRGHQDIAPVVNPDRALARVNRSLRPREQRQQTVGDFRRGILEEGQDRSVVSGLTYRDKDGRQLTGAEALYEMSGAREESERRKQDQRRRLVGGGGWL